MDETWECDPACPPAPPDVCHEEPDLRPQAAQVCGEFDSGTTFYGRAPHGNKTALPRVTVVPNYIFIALQNIF